MTTRWTYRHLDAFRYIVTNDDETLMFGCPTIEEAQHLTNYLNSLEPLHKAAQAVVEWWDQEEYEHTDLPLEALRDLLK